MANKKAIPLDLTADVIEVPSVAYDQTKTNAYGRAKKKILSALQGGKTVVGTPLNVFADTLTDALPTVFSGVRGCASNNGHELLFNTSSATGVVLVSLYDIDEATGVKTYVGKIQLTLPSTTHTQRFGRLVNDSGSTGWRILIGTIGATPALGGLFSVENIAKADFVPGTPTIIPTATAAGQKAVYWHQETGGTNNLTVMQGGGHDHDAGLVTHKIVIANGLVASPNFYVFDSSVAIATVGGGGVTTDWYTLAKTGTVPGLTGTFLLLDNYSVCVPSADSGAPIALQGQTCFFIPGSTGFGLVKVSDLAPGVVTLPSYASKDVLDTPLTNTGIAPLTMHFSQTLQRIVMQTASVLIIKKFVNAQFEQVFGNSTNSQYRQTQPVAFYEFGVSVSVSTHEHGGWLHLMSNTTGQNGVTSFDLRSLWQQDYSKIISKVLDVPHATFASLSVITVIRSFAKIWYKLSGFATPLTGWLEVPEDRDMSGIANTTGQVQFMFQTRMERDSVTIPIQILESYLILNDLLQNSGNWALDHENSTKSSESPAKSAAILEKAYAGAVPSIQFSAYSRATGALVLQKDTAAHAAEFSYSTTSGASWIALGTIPNTINTTRLRYNWSTPIPEDVDVVWREA